MTTHHPQPTLESVEATHRVDLLRTMLLIRRFEEKCAELYSASKIRGFLHLYIGEEAVATGVISQLDADDSLVTTYREHGHALARGIPSDSLMAEMFGKQTGCSRGRGGSMHIFDAATRFVGGNAIVGGGLPLAVGIALADKLRGFNRVTACFFGDGALAEGEFHESMNLAALWALPVLFCCENNRYAMGTRLSATHADTDLALRASTYGMASWPVDGMDVLAVEAAAQRAIESIRGGGGPAFLELQTYRFRAHSMYDPERYRDKEEVARWRERDPIAALSERLVAEGSLDDERVAELEDEIAAILTAAIESADRAPAEPISDLTRFVYTEQP